MGRSRMGWCATFKIVRARIQWIESSESRHLSAPLFTDTRDLGVWQLVAAFNRSLTPRMAACCHRLNVGKLEIGDRSVPLRRQQAGAPQRLAKKRQRPA